MSVHAVGERPTPATKRSLDLWRMGVLPVLMLGALSGLVGIYWDIAWHIDKGRDTFFTPPHNFIYLAMLTVVAASVWGLARDRRASPLHLPVGRYRLHPGILVVAIGAALVLFFAPADDLWHRLFGADVTLWAPMHLIGVLGLVLLGFGGLTTAWIERLLTRDPGRIRLLAGLTIFFAAALLGWFMLLLAEYEFAIPAFPLFWHPLLLLALPPLALTLVARLAPLPWSATWTALLFTALRLLLAGGLMITAGFDLAGNTRPLIPILLLAGPVADLLAQRRLPGWLHGPLIGLAALLPTWPLAVAGGMAWHAGALAWGLPLGLLLSIPAGLLGRAVAEALGPADELPPVTA